MKVVVSTPAGHVGSRVVQLLIQAGVRPTLLAHHPARLDPAVQECADVVEADVSDAATVVRATRDADALFWVSPSNFDPAADPVAWYTRLGANAARAVTENRIGRTVFLSSVGAEKRSGAGEIDGLARTEEYLDATGAAVLHLRCGYFFTNVDDLDAIRDGVIRAPMALDFAQPWVDPRDIGEIAAVRLLGRPGQAARSRPCTAPKTSRSPRSPRSSARQSAAGYGPRQSPMRPGVSRCAPLDSAISRSMAFPG